MLEPRFRTTFAPLRPLPTVLYLPAMTDNADGVEHRNDGIPVDGEPQRRWQLEQGDEIVPGRYVVERLGGGSEYEAFLAWDDRMLALVVAKCLRPHLVDDADSLRRLARESGYLLGLRHPVVVRGFDVVLDGPRPHVVMEHLEGPNLASLLRRYGPLALHQLLPLALQICGALHYLAQERVVHLDVKPRNTIMTAPPRLIDLSVARSFDDAARIRGQVGTDAYMAPEQCRPGSVPIGPPADVFGLGATLYHAVAGGVPFPRPDYVRDRDDADLDVRFPQLHRQPQPLPREVPVPLAQVVLDCLAKDPEQRPTFGEIVERLEPVVSGLPTRPVLRRLRPRLR
ncbi:MAG: serine/threonine protein kinase [Actinomycetota bacterium]|nr:serine/threonine protein kinase [Actinomycetota bacterium]